MEEIAKKCILVWFVPKPISYLFKNNRIIISQQGLSQQFCNCRAPFKFFWWETFLTSKILQTDLSRKFFLIPMRVETFGLQNSWLHSIHQIVDWQFSTQFLKNAFGPLQSKFDGQNSQELKIGMIPLYKQTLFPSKHLSGLPPPRFQSMNSLCTKWFDISIFLPIPFLKIW